MTIQKLTFPQRSRTKNEMDNRNTLTIHALSLLFYDNQDSPSKIAKILRCAIVKSIQFIFDGFKYDRTEAKQKWTEEFIFELNRELREIK